MGGAVRTRGGGRWRGARPGSGCAVGCVAMVERAAAPTLSSAKERREMNAAGAIQKVRPARFPGTPIL